MTDHTSVPKDAPIRAISSNVFQSGVPPKSLENYGGEIIMITNQTGSAVEVINESILGKRVRPPGEPTQVKWRRSLAKTSEPCSEDEVCSIEQKDEEEPVP